MSARELRWQDAEGHKGVMQPSILELPVSLWGRDLLLEMGFKLSNDSPYSLKAQAMIRDMGFYPSFGVGKYLQGRRNPVQARGNKGKEGLGFS